MFTPDYPDYTVGISVAKLHQELRDIRISLAIIAHIMAMRDGIPKEDYAKLLQEEDSRYL